MNHTDCKTVARNFYESYNNRDLDQAFDQYIASDLINHTLSGGLDRAKWLDFDKAFLTACPDLKLTIKQQVAEENGVVTHWVAEGVHAADFMGMKATGNPIQLTGISIDRIEDGKIREHLAMADFTQFMQQFSK